MSAVTGRSRWWFGVVACAAASLSAAAPPPTGTPSLRDMTLAAQARKSLLDDPALAFLNLSVQVRGGVATVWGPVPSEEVGRRAVRRLERVKGLKVVRNETFTTAPPKGDEGLEVPYVLREPEEPKPALAPAPPVPMAPRPPALTGQLTNSSPAGPQTSVSLQAPEPTPRVVAGAIDQLRRADPRFRPLVVDLRETTVVVHGSSGPGEHVMAFAQAIAQLPGVERVVVQPGK